MKSATTPWRKNYPYSDRIYEALPFIYVTAGLATMLWFRHMAGIASGFIFITAGMVVWYWRYRYRREFIHSQGNLRIPTVFREESASPRLVELNWKDNFHCGHPVLDAQHRRLFGICNVLIDMLSHNASKFEMEHELTELIDHVTDHFRTEEEVLASSESPLSADHQLHHINLLEKAKDLRIKYVDDTIVARDLISFIAYDLIAGHLLFEDLKWATIAVTDCTHDSTNGLVPALSKN